MAVFSQGKVSLQMDGGSLITLGPPVWVLAADEAVAGQPVSTTGPLPSGIVLEVGLYAGTSSTLLTLQTDVLLNPPGGTGLPAGAYPATHVILTGIPGGSLAYFQVWVWNSAYPSPAASFAGDSYAASDNIFTMTPGSSIGFPGINNGGNTTWAAVGNESPFILAGPEPSAFALGLLGAAALAIFRRCKSAGALRT